MKRLLIVILLFGIITGYSNMVFAEDVNVTVGLKTWIATWDHKLEFLNEVTGETEIVSDKSDYGLMYGPVVNFRYEKFFASLSYLLGGDFNFEWDQLDYSDPDYGYNLDLDSKDDRTYFDIAIGYYIHPNISVFLGYKNIDIDETATLVENVEPFSDADFDGFVDSESSIDSSATIKGPAFGVSGNYRIGESNWILIGSLSYLSLDGESEGESLGDFTGPSLEIGGAYVLDTMPLSITAGFKYQSLKADESEDIFSGLTVGVNYSF